MNNLNRIKKLRKNKVESNSIQLYDYQHEKLNEMIEIDSYFETPEFFGKKYNFKAGSGLLNLGVGNGKTIVTCKRVEHWLNHKLEILKEKRANCACTRLHDKIKELIDLNSQSQQSKFQMSISSKQDRNTIGISPFFSNISFIIVPSILFTQWERELYRCLDHDLFSKHVVSVRYKNKFYDFGQNDQIKIILITTSLMSSFIRNNKFNMGPIDMIFIDEIHLKINQHLFDLIIDRIDFNFIWGLSGNEAKSGETSMCKHDIFMEISAETDFSQEFFRNALKLKLANLSWKDDMSGDMRYILESALKYEHWNDKFFEKYVSQHLEQNKNNAMMSFKNNFQTIVYGQEMSSRLPAPESHDLFYKLNTINSASEEWNWKMIDLNLIPDITEYINSFILKKNETCLKNLKERFVEWETIDQKLFQHHYRIELENLQQKRATLEARLEETCPICFDNKSFLLPCCNQTICVLCIQTLETANSTMCPYCRQNIETFFQKEKIDLQMCLGQERTSLFYKLLDLTNDLIEKNKNTKILIVYDLQLPSQIFQYNFNKFNPNSIIRSE